MHTTTRSSINRIQHRFTGWPYVFLQVPSAVEETRYMRLHRVLRVTVSSVPGLSKNLPCTLFSSTFFSERIGPSALCRREKPIGPRPGSVVWPPSSVPWQWHALLTGRDAPYDSRCARTRILGRSLYRATPRDVAVLPPQARCGLSVVGQYLACCEGAGHYGQVGITPRSW